MSHYRTPHEMFFTRNDLDEGRIERLVGDALGSADDGELFMEYVQSEGLSFDDGKLKTASFDTSQGIGLRRVVGEATAYSHASEVSEAAIKRAAETVKAIDGRSGVKGEAPLPTNRKFYDEVNPLAEMPFEDKDEPEDCEENAKGAGNHHHDGSGQAV